MARWNLESMSAGSIVSTWIALKESYNIKVIMVIALWKYYFSLLYWNKASLPAIKKMQLMRFKQLFEHAVRFSRFYREYYGDHGILDLKINSLSDIRRIPLINKSILRSSSTRDIMTCELNEHIHICSTSGSSGEPFKIAFNRYEDYTAHVRVFWALRKAGYRLGDGIIIVGRYGAGEKFVIESDVSAIGTLQRGLGLFRREIISIYEPVDDIIAKLQRSQARLLWSTPSIMQIVCNRLREMGARLSFPLVFLTSEAVSPQQKKLFLESIGKEFVHLYGTIESPSLGFDFGFRDRFVIFPNSNYFEFERLAEGGDGNPLGKVVITNLINRTMPVIRYDLGDLAEVDEQPGFGCQYIRKIVGRQDDILRLADGRFLAHHHAHEMFMDFHECEMFKFVQKLDQSVLLQLKIDPRRDSATVRRLAGQRWRKRFGETPLKIEFVDDFQVDARTGKFKNIEIER